MDYHFFMGDYRTRRVFSFERSTVGWLFRGYLVYCGGLVGFLLRMDFGLCWGYYSLGFLVGLGLFLDC